MAAHSKSNSVNGKSSRDRRALQLLRLRIMASLNKLSDRDTYRIAVEELHLLCGQIGLPQFPAAQEGIIPIHLFLSCLYETLSASDAAHDQRPVVKKECVRMFGKLASLHGDKLSPHLPRIVPHIVRRLRDPDSGVRDMCADVMGVLSAKVSPPHKPKTRKRREEEEDDDEDDDEEEEEEEDDDDEAKKMDVNSFNSLNFFADPLFDALNAGNAGNESRNMQIGASMCLARVIDNIRFNPSPLSSQRMCHRVLKLLNSPRFHAKAALLPAIAQIVQSGGASINECLSMVMACVQECLKSNDWGTRKAASETLLAISTACDSHLSLATYKPSVLDALEHCRYDKVKPVRDIVTRTLRAWKSMVDPGNVHLDCFEKEAQCPKGSVQSSVTSSSSSSLTSKLTSNSISISTSSSSPSSWCVDSSSQSEEVEMGSWSLEETCTYDNDSSNTTVDVHDVSNTSEKDSALIRRRLARIEMRQASILELLQKFMERSDETFLKLDGRIDVVESSMCRQATSIRRPH